MRLFLKSSLLLIAMLWWSLLQAAASGRIFLAPAEAQYRVGESIEVRLHYQPAGPVDHVQVVAGVEGEPPLLNQVAYVTPAGEAYQFRFRWRPDKAGIHGLYFHIDPDNRQGMAWRLGQTVRVVESIDGGAVPAQTLLPPCTGPAYTPMLSPLSPQVGEPLSFSLELGADAFQQGLAGRQAIRLTLFRPGYARPLASQRFALKDPGGAPRPPIVWSLDEGLAAGDYEVRAVLPGANSCLLGEPLRFRVHPTASRP